MWKRACFQVSLLLAVWLSVPGNWTPGLYTIRGVEVPYHDVGRGWAYLPAGEVGVFVPPRGPEEAPPATVTVFVGG